MSNFIWSADPVNRLDSDGKSLEYVCFGPKPDQAPTILLLHEGLGCVALWRDFPAKLAKASGLGVMAYSRAGYGQSDPADLPRPLDYMTREAVDCLPQIIAAAGLQKIILLGHSDGASIAAIYAGSVEDHRVRGLILMAPHFFTEAMGLASIADAKVAYENTNLATRMSKYHKNPDNTFYGWNDSWLHTDFKNWNITDVIDYIRIPVLAIQGREDQYGTTAQIEALEAQIYAPLDIELLEDCQHSPFLEQPDLTLGSINNFCARLHAIETAQSPTR